MARVRVARTDEIPPGKCKAVTAGERDLALCNVGGEFHAIDNECPHAGGPLGFGFLEGHELTCPLHAWTFDVRTGLMVGSDDLRVASYPTSVENNEVFVEV